MLYHIILWFLIGIIISIFCIILNNEKNYGFKVFFVDDIYLVFWFMWSGYLAFLALIVVLIEGKLRKPCLTFKRWKGGTRHLGKDIFWISKKEKLRYKKTLDKQY